MSSELLEAEVAPKYRVNTEETGIPAGYKQTEVGVIPEDWEICELGEAITFQRGFDLPQRQRIAGEVPIISSSGVSGFHNRAVVKAPGIVTGRYGTIGEIFFLSQDFWPLNTTLYIREFKKVLPKYTLHLLKTVDFSSHSGKSGVPGVNRNDVHQEIIVLPPKKEQTAIANVLSDVDALISELEKLIAKKQAIKTATMQQLLTGRTRLPEFALHEDGSKKGYKQSELGEIPEDWEVTNTSEVCDLLTGFPFPSNNYTDSGVRLLRGANVKRNCTDWSKDITQYWPEVSAAFKQYELKHGDIVVSMDGSLVGKSFTQLSKQDLPALLLQRVARLRSKIISQNYLKEWVCSKFFTEHCDSVKTVTAIPHISPQDIRYFKLLLPPTVAEQTAIATILSDMDKEVQALEQRLNKTRQIKQGMIQELLTGRTRLVTPGSGVKNAN